MEGKYIGIVGSCGAGKTTLAQALAVRSAELFSTVTQNGEKQQLNADDVERAIKLLNLEPDVSELKDFTGLFVKSTVD